MTRPMLIIAAVLGAALALLIGVRLGRLDRPRLDRDAWPEGVGYDA